MWAACGPVAVLRVRSTRRAWVPRQAPPPPPARRPSLLPTDGSAAVGAVNSCEGHQFPLRVLLVLRRPMEFSSNSRQVLVHIDWQSTRHERAQPQGPRTQLPGASEVV